MVFWTVRRSLGKLITFSKSAFHKRRAIVIHRTEPNMTVDQLIDAAYRQGRLPGPKTVAWLKSLAPDEARARLADHVLTESDQAVVEQLGMRLNDFMTAKLSLRAPA
jgi:phage I-like protein